MKKEQLRIGLEVRTNVDFSGVRAGTVGEVVEASNSWPATNSVAVRWSRFEGDTLTDWFDAEDELQFLDPAAHMLI